MGRVDERGYLDTDIVSWKESVFFPCPVRGKFSYKEEVSTEETRKEHEGEDQEGRGCSLEWAGLMREDEKRWIRLVGKNLWESRGCSVVDSFERRG